MPIVSILQGMEPFDLTLKALNLIMTDFSFSPYDKVLIKPNYVAAKEPKTGVTTDIRIIKGVIKFFKDRGVKTIKIAEGSGFSDTVKAFRLVGIDHVANHHQVDLVDLNKDEFVEVKIMNAIKLKKVRIARTVLESNFIVSIPKLKIHNLTKVSLSLKNMIGVISPKAIMHSSLEDKIVDLLSIVKPQLALIDGSIGCAGGELGGSPVQMNLVIAGTDPVAVDAVGTAIMGIDPSKVKHIQLAEELGLGVGNLKKIKIVGEPIGKVKKIFVNLWIVPRLARFLEVSRILKALLLTDFGRKLILFSYPRICETELYIKTCLKRIKELLKNI